LKASLRESKPMAKKGRVVSFVGRHADKVKRSISIEEMTEIAAAGWAGEIKDQGDTSCERFTPYDPADSLNNEEEIALFLADAAETGDTQYMAHAREIAKRARLRNRLLNAS